MALSSYQFRGRGVACARSSPRFVAPGPIRCPVACRASAAVVATEELLDTLKQAARKPGSVPPSEVLKAVVGVEKAKPKLPEDWFETISAPSKRWRLIYTAASKDVQAALKGTPAKGGYFPLAAAQKFGSDNTFENGVFLGPVGHLTFKGPCASKGKQLSFDVHTMYIGLGPWRVGIPLKKDGKPLAEVDAKEVRKLPFFLYAYIDNDIIVYK